MSKHLDALRSLIDNLSTRERILVLLGAIAIVYILWDNFLIAPAQKSYKQLTNEHLNIQGQNSDLERRRILASGLLNNSRREQVIKEIKKIEQKIKNFDGLILERLQGRVAPEYMSSLLNDVLQKNQRLQLIRVNNLPAEPFIKKNKKDADKKSRATDHQIIDSKLMGIFLHSLELELQGSYLDILKYLQDLEALQWKIFWDQVKLEVLDYPKVKVQIRVHTFSLKEGWLSV